MMNNNQLTRNHNIVFLFSGQGSHYRGMGSQLFKNNITFSQSLKDSDNYIKQRLGVSIIDEIYSNKNNHFDDLIITHPAILAIELALLDVMNELEIHPHYVAGNSLGELAAAVAAGVWTKKEALEYAAEQAMFIVERNDEGGMIAIINQPLDKVKSMIAGKGLQVASRNLENHCTIVGGVYDILQFQNELEISNIQFSRLPVAYPFHSTLLNGYHVNSLDVPRQSVDSKRKFVSGLYCSEMTNLPDNYFWNVISLPMNFIQFVTYMETLGPSIYIDLGPSGTNATFFKYNMPETTNSIAYQIMTPFNKEMVQLNSLELMLNSNKRF